jgi:ribosomal protein S28E/S33
MMNTGQRGVITDVLLVLIGGKETERTPFRAVTAAITARTTIE